MSTVRDFFQASADNFGDTMFATVGALGFKLPDYQRPYDWNKENLHRLFLDCLNGFYRAAESDTEEYTFLGTIILSSDQAREHNFDRQPLLIVDGQQRLTTLLLLTCALFNAIRDHQGDISRLLNSEVAEWLNQECMALRDLLYLCTTGQKHSTSGDTLFPRIVRSGDRIDGSTRISGYQSPIANFLREFEQYCKDPNKTFPPNGNEASTDTQHLLRNFKIISEEIIRYVYNGLQDGDGETPVVASSQFGRLNCQRLFIKLQPKANRDQLVKTISTSTEAEGLIRLLLFSSYLMHSVVLTSVVARSEDIAFDIFDALNTTGEPLTALETLKPHIIQFENTRGGFKGSESELSWKTIEEHINEKYADPARRQKETKELMTSFAVYYLGEKLGSDLKLQRDTIRGYFKNASIPKLGDGPAREIVRSLGKIAEFRHLYWDTREIDSLPQRNAQGEELKLCLRFLADTNTSTVIPILARYWIEYEKEDPDLNFLNATKAVAAFLTLRRAMTGGTAGIDSDFRNLMFRKPGPSVDPLCTGKSFSNEIFSVEKLKEILQSYLKGRPFGVVDKNTWLARAKEDVPLATSSSPVCRFLLFAAAHHARPDKDRPGLFTVSDEIPSDKTNFFNFGNWIGEKYATVEHVAPDADPKEDWDKEIYSRTTRRHTIGNLVLLPQRENQGIGNASWRKKKTFYRALSSTTKSQRQRQIKLAEKEGYKLGKKTVALLDSREALHLLEPVPTVRKWSARFIEERTENILSLAWDRISPWLFD